MTTTTRVLLLIVVGVGLLSAFGLVSAQQRARVQGAQPAHLTVYMHGMLITAMAAFAVWPVLHYIGLRTDSGLSDVPSLPFLIASAAALAGAAAFGIARLVMALTARRRPSSADQR